MKHPNSLSDRGLLQYAEEHLQYEVDMLTWSTGILAFLAPHMAEGYLPSAINNGLLNSFALHARNLINFLYSRSRRTDYRTDVILEDYVDADIVASSLPAITPLLEEALTKANKQAAHLSLDRIQYQQAGKQWSFIEITKQILAALASIAPHIPSGRISDSLRQKLTQSGFRIPIVDISTRQLPSGAYVSATFSLRISQDGETIKSVPA